MYYNTNFGINCSKFKKNDKFFIVKVYLQLTWSCVRTVRFNTIKQIFAKMWFLIQTLTIVNKNSKLLHSPTQNWHFDNVTYIINISFEKHQSFWTSFHKVLVLAGGMRILLLETPPCFKEHFKFKQITFLLSHWKMGCCKHSTPFWDIFHG